MARPLTCRQPDLAGARMALPQGNLLGDGEAVVLRICPVDGKNRAVVFASLKAHVYAVAQQLVNSPVGFIKRAAIEGRPPGAICRKPLWPAARSSPRVAKTKQQVFNHRRVFCARASRPDMCSPNLQTA